MCVHGSGLLPLVMVYLGKGVLSAEQRAELSRKITGVMVEVARQPQHYT